MNMRITKWAVPGIALGVLAFGCIEREGRPVNPCTNVTVARAIQVTSVDKVDLLFMVDNSNSMSEEQTSLASELPSMVRILASGDFDQDGDGVEDGEPDDPDFEPVQDLNVGVITSDMGTGGFTVPTCARSDFGDDGILRTTGRTDIMGCMASYPPFLNFTPDGGRTPDQFGTDVGCVATVGTGGCGFEQQLEAILKAASPSAPTSWTADGYAPPMFFRGTSGHADDQNDGFVRDNSVLAIIPVTDEEDCSALDPELFNPSSATYGATDLNLRCFAHADMALHPISRFVDGYLQLRRSAGLLIYAPIVGIPVDLAPGPGESPNYDQLVGPPGTRDERMEERVDPATPNRLVPSCDIPGRGQAFPPVRIVRVAQELQNRGAGVTVQSICQDDFSGALREIIRQIASALGAACLPRQLNVEADGSVDCDVVAEMPEGVGCEALGAAGEVRLDTDGNALFTEDGNSICTIFQRVPTREQKMAGTEPSEPGWYYDDYTMDVQSNCGTAVIQGQRVAFTSEPPSGATVRLECFQSVQSGGENVMRAQVGTFCDPESPPSAESSDPNPCGGGVDPAGRDNVVQCDRVTRACGVPCTNDSDCRAAGLVGFVCDTRPLNEVDESLMSTEPHNFCVNPTC